MHKISTKELFTICTFLCIFLFPGFGNVLIIKYASSTSIITSIIGIIIGLVPLFLIIYLKKHTNKYNIFQLNKKYFKIFGIIINTLLIIYAIYVLFIGVWLVTNFITSQYLTRTSCYIVAIAIATTISFACYKGTEVTLRTSLICFMIFIIIIILTGAFLIPVSSNENIYPILNINKPNFINALLTYPCFATIPLIFILFIKNKQISTNKINKKIIFAYIISCFITVSFLYLIMSTFGPNIASMLSYPEYYLLKKIKILNFIERIENIASLVIFLSYFVGYSTTLIFIKEGIKNLFKLKTGNLLIIIINYVIPIICVYLFINFNMNFIYRIFPIISLIVFVIITINCSIIFIYKKINRISSFD